MSGASTLLWGVGGLFLLRALTQGSPFPEDQNLTDDDYDLLNGDPDKVGELLAQDNSPVFFTVPSGGWTAAERLAIVQSITTKYSAQIEKIALNMDAKLDFITEGIVSLLNYPDAAYSEKAIGLFLKMHEIWSQRVADTAESCASSIAAIAVEAGIASANATTCTKTTFVKNVTEDVSYTSSEYSKVTVSNKGKSVLFGAFGSKKSSKTVETWKTELRSEHREIVFIPHCTEWAIDPVKIETILASSTMGMQMVYSLLKSVIATAPNPKYFVS